jgi:hypothetical protein
LAKLMPSGLATTYYQSKSSFNEENFIYSHYSKTYS